MGRHRRRVRLDLGTRGKDFVEFLCYISNPPKKQIQDTKMSYVKMSIVIELSFKKLLIIYHNLKIFFYHGFIVMSA